MILDGNRRSGLVNSSMLFYVDFLGNLVLLLRIRYNFLVLQHQLFGFAIVSASQFVMSSSAAEPTLLGSISAPRVFGVLQVISNLLKAVL
jgi:hypothetical protein